jgi:hypothetical protein
MDTPDEPRKGGNYSPWHDEETRQTYLDEVEKHGAVELALQSVGISRKSLFRYRLMNPEFAAAEAVARKEGRKQSVKRVEQLCVLKRALGGPIPVYDRERYDLEPGEGETPEERHKNRRMVPRHVGFDYLPPDLKAGLSYLAANSPEKWARNYGKQAQPTDDPIESLAQQIYQKLLREDGSVLYEEVLERVRLMVTPPDVDTESTEVS